ncbi:MAG: aspartate kinase [Bacteroidales bacterium]|nr:MAG: aspartate kinase [Bacteroidales bacterium]
MSSGIVKVFKFGGASVRSAEGVRNLANVVKRYPQNLVIVVSAMGKTTNALEIILSKYLDNDITYKDDILKLKRYHTDIATELFNGERDIENGKLESIFSEIEAFTNVNKNTDYNYCYDQIVSYGELISTAIVSAYLNSAEIKNKWVDARSCLKTDTNYREGNIDYKLSQSLSKESFSFQNERVYLTQGFIAGTAFNTTTTLGREGSDYTAAILANLLDAEDVTIWKDVEGVLNADPKLFKNTCKLDFVSFQEAIELAYCGAQIIHPKTIKPLQNKKIPLHVKSFLNPDAIGTKIFQSETSLQLPPVLVLKRNQVLISLTPRDFSFVIEDSLSQIFAILYKHRVKVNMIHTSAITFSVCVDEEKHYLPAAIEELRSDFAVKYNKELELLTIRHHTQDVIDEHISGKQIYMQQRTRSTARFVMDAIER